MDPFLTSLIINDFEKLTFISYSFISEYLACNLESFFEDWEHDTSASIMNNDANQLTMHKFTSELSDKQQVQRKF